MSREGRINQPFVESSKNELGIGKLVELNGDTATVEYFRSPADDEPIKKIVRTSSLTRFLLPPETRAYYRNPETITTEVGRVLDYQKNDHLYLVRFPNDQTRMIASDHLQVRCRLPIAEPTDHLAHQLNETAFWHEGRSEFVRHLLAQHGASRGLSALISSSVELVAHQASVIHRVLLDPFQRYLLADEVELGKTIEAGVLIKQFALDEPNANDTLIIVPDSLVVQWQLELTHRFHLGRLLGDSIHIVRSRDIQNIAAYIPAARMIVIDEAHHLSSWAWSSNTSERNIFDTVKRGIEDLNRKVLLLSATPVLHNEQSFLAMLHLLDPQVYPLDSLDLFEQRVRLRQEIAECMLSLDETASNFFLAETLEELGTLLVQDAEFQSLRAKLSSPIEADVDEKDSERVGLILSIRTHISDMWRLHRRILRNRRTENTAAYLPGRGGLKRVTYQCNCEIGLNEAVESWRLSLSAACYSADEAKKGVATLLARTMAELAACEPRKVLEFASQRLKAPVSGGDEDCLGTFPLIDGEVDLLQQIVRAANDCDQEEKLQSILRLIGTEVSGDSFVVFANYSETADRIFEFLDLRLSPGRTLRHSPGELGWRQFKSSNRGYPDSSFNCLNDTVVALSAPTIVGLDVRNARRASTDIGGKRHVRIPSGRPSRCRPRKRSKV